MSDGGGFMAPQRSFASSYARSGADSQVADTAVVPPVRRETELLDAFEAPLGGSSPAHRERKAEAIRAILVSLSTEDRATLSKRLATSAQRDRLANAFHRPSDLGRDRISQLRALVDAPASSAAPQSAPAQNASSDDTSEIETTGGPQSPASGNALGHKAFNAKMTNQLSAASRAGVPVTAPGFLHLHLTEVVRASHLFLVARTIPSGDPQVTLRDGFYDLLFEAFTDGDIAAGVTRLRNWVEPEDLYALVDRSRPIFEDGDVQANAPQSALDYEHGRKGPAQWFPAVGVAIGSLLEGRMRESLARMSPRLVAATARKRQAAKASGSEPDAVEAKELVTSHPLDWKVAQAMTGNGTPGVTVKSGTLNVRDDINTTYRKVRRVETHKSSNAVRPIDPPDATIEEIATFLLGKPTEAYRLRRVGDFFVVADGSDVTNGREQTATKATELAFGADAALVETAEVERAMKNDVDAKAPEGPAFPTMQAAWGRIHEQLVGLTLVVGPYGLDAQLVAATNRHAAHKLDLGTLSGRAALVRVELFARQEILLTKVAADVGAIVSDAQKRSAGAKAAKKGDATASADATRNALVKLVTAAGLAHLPETGEAAYEEAHVARRDLMLTTFAAQLGDIATQLEIARLAMAHSIARSRHSEAVFKTSLQDRADALRRRLAALRSRMLSGTATTEEVEALYSAIDSLRFEAGVVASVGQLGDAFETLDQLENQGWILFSEEVTSSKLPDLAEGKQKPNRLEEARRTGAELRGDLQTLHSQWLKVQAQAIHLAETLEAGGAKNAGDQALALVAPQLAIIKGKLAKLGGEEKIQSFLSDAYDKAKSAERRSLIVRIATLIGITVVSGGVAALGEGVALGMGASALGAQLVGLGLETTTFTMLDAAISGDSLVHAFTSNFLGNLATFGAMRGVNAKIAGSAIGRTLAKAAAGERVALLARFAAKMGAITAPALVAVGVQFAQAEYESLLATGKTMSLAELKMAGVQGIAMMIGAAVTHKVFGETTQNIKAAGVRAGAKAQQRARIRALGEAVMQSGDPTQAMELLHQAREALEHEGDELHALDELPDNQLEAQGLSRPVVEALSERNRGNMAALDALEGGTTTAQLGLDTVVPGQVYAGDHAAVKRVIDQYRARGYRIQAEAGGHRVVGPDGQVFHVLEREAAGPYEPTRPENAAPASTAKPPAGSPPAHAADEHPAHTPFGEVWPGEVPENAPPAQREVFEAAKRVYDGLKKDGFQGAAIGRIRWEHYLVEHGIPVDGSLHSGGRHAIHEISAPTRPAAPSDLALPRDPTVGARSANTGHVNKAQCLSALDEILGGGTMLEGAHRDGDVVRIKLADGRTWTIKIAEPKPTHADEMAALTHGEKGDTVWVSDTLTNEQVPRALGAIIGESLASTGQHGGDGARFGELDAMLAHRDKVAAEPAPETPRNATPAQVKAHALASSRAEATGRIDAEIDLVLHRMGLDDAGTRRDEHLAAMPADLAAKVRSRLAQRATIGFRPDAIRPENAVAHAAKTPEKPLGVSEVIPDAPATVRPYTEADRARVLELRVELEAIREIDARTAHRDRPGTNSGADIAKGETQRRADHVARAKAMMAELQLGGDTAYLKERLAELAAVFPGVERDVVPAMEQRAQRRDVATAKHHEAEAFRAERTRQMQALVARIKGMKVITTSRLVVGDGFSGLADIATLGTKKQGAWIDPAELLVIGNPDLIARLAESDPSFRWGQRAAAYDRPTDAHPAFSDASGRGTGELDSVVEDPGEFLHAGETRDAMDLARKRLGVVAVPGEVQTVETFAEKDPGSPAWEVDQAKYQVRTRVMIDGQERFVYAENVDLTTGPGKPRAPNETILSKEDRQTLSGPKGDGPLFSGEKILEGRDVRGKRVLVLAFGPTGAWVAKVAADRGAARVDFAGGTGGELGTGGRIKNKPGQPQVPRGETAGNDSALQNNVASLDRLQDVASGSANVHITLDRIIHIEPFGEGAIVTYAHGPGENAEVYQVEYDAIATTMGFSTAQTAREMLGEPTVKEMVGNTKMIPQRGTDAPILEDAKTGRVRIMGFAAGDGVNVSGRPGERGSDRETFERRRGEVKADTSADSPDDRVVEGAGMSSRDANTPQKRDGK